VKPGTRIAIPVSHFTISSAGVAIPGSGIAIRSSSIAIRDPRTVSPYTGIVIPKAKVARRESKHTLPHPKDLCPPAGDDKLVISGCLPVAEAHLQLAAHAAMSCENEQPL